MVELENRYRCKDGSYRRIAWAIVASEGAFHCVGRDVTEEKKGQIELVAAQEALRQSQKLEAMGQLTGGVPMTSTSAIAGRFSRQAKNRFLP